MYCELPRKKVFKNQNGLLINQYLIDTIQDISTLPTQISKPTYDRCAAGSTAYCIENQNYYILNNNNEWLVYDENGEGNNNSINKKIENDITFYDYDGTIIASYSVSDFMELNSLPENPDHTDKGLTSQGWNWSFENAREYVESYGKLNIGQMYIPTDGKTHIFIDIPEDIYNYTVNFNFRHKDSSGQTVINWGDNSQAETVNQNESSTYLTHTYINSGKYEITFNTINGIVNFSNECFSNIINSSIKLEYIYFNDKTFIGDRAFQKNILLKNITIPENITYIGSSAFYNCVFLQSVVIPKNCIIESDAFSGCENLNHIILPEILGSINSNAFQATKIKNITISKNTTGIGSRAFIGCRNLQNIVIPESVTDIGSEAFSGCINLQNIVIPENVTDIGSEAFKDCYSLQELNIPQGVTTINDRIAKGCYNLQNIIIPSSVTEIYSYSFNYCPSVNTIHLKPINPPTWKGETSYGVLTGLSNNTKFYVPAESLEAYKTANRWTNYADRIFAEPE